MTIGIYKLVFKGTNKIYIGSSTNIEMRFNSHLRSYRDGRISKKLAIAFETFGNPSLEIIAECEENELLAKEIFAVKYYKCIENGFNTVRVIRNF